MKFQVFIMQMKDSDGFITDGEFCADMHGDTMKI